MRHSDPRITVEVYSHVVGGSQRKAVEKVAQSFQPLGFVNVTTAGAEPLRRGEAVEGGLNGT